MNIDILGTTYQINEKDELEDALLSSRFGYCDNTTKEIVIGKLQAAPGTNVNVEPEKKRLMRHEIIHAFMYESGLDENSEWGTDETLVDWIALQFPKMLKAFMESEAI